MRAIYGLRPDEFWVALVTAIVVVVLGVEQGIILAIVLSLIVHVKRHLPPNNAVVRCDEQGHLRLAEPPRARHRARPGHLPIPCRDLLRQRGAPRRGCPCAWSMSPIRRAGSSCTPRAIDDIDYTGAQTLLELADHLHQRGIVLAVAEASDDLRRELDRFGLTDKIGPDRYLDSLQAAREAFQSS